MAGRAPLYSAPLRRKALADFDEPCPSSGDGEERIGHLGSQRTIPGTRRGYRKCGKAFPIRERPYPLPTCKGGKAEPDVQTRIKGKFERNCWSSALYTSPDQESYRIAGLGHMRKQTSPSLSILIRRHLENPTR